jgi:hypothetical protein
VKRTQRVASFRSALMPEDTASLHPCEPACANFAPPAALILE